MTCLVIHPHEYFRFTAVPECWQLSPNAVSQCETVHIFFQIVGNVDNRSRRVTSVYSLDNLRIW